MKQKRHLLLITLCTFTLLLAACSTGSPSSTDNTSHTTKLMLRETPAATDTSGATTPGATTTATTEERGVYLGEMTRANSWIGLSSNGKHVVAFVTDGSKDHPVTFAQWFRGDLANNVVDVTAPDKNGNDHLQAMLTKTNASGTITFANGKSLAFTANALQDTSGDAGLYRSERVVNGDHFIAGWVLLPETASTSPGLPHIPRVATGTATGESTATATPTVSATSSATPSATTLPQGGGLRNQKTSAVQPVPELTSQEIQARQVNIPSVGTFRTVACRQFLC
jgi:hypothetical protein